MSEGLVLTLQELIDEHVLGVLRVTNGNKSKAARLLGVRRSRLRRLAQRAIIRDAARSVFIPRVRGS